MNLTEFHVVMKFQLLFLKNPKENGEKRTKRHQI